MNFLTIRALASREEKRTFTRNELRSLHQAHGELYGNQAQRAYSEALERGPVLSGNSAVNPVNNLDAVTCNVTRTLSALNPELIQLSFEFSDNTGQACCQRRARLGNAYVERLIGSIRRECLDHVIVFNESSLRRILSSYCSCYQNWRTHLSLGKDARKARRVQQEAYGQIVEIAEVGGLHHHYKRRAA